MLLDANTFKPVCLTPLTAASRARIPTSCTESKVLDSFASLFILWKTLVGVFLASSIRPIPFSITSSIAVRVVLSKALRPALTKSLN